MKKYIYTTWFALLINFLIWAFIILILTSCGSTKETRKTKRASHRIEKLERKSKRIAIENGLTIQDTLTSYVNYYTTAVRTDSIFSHSVDTVYLNKGNLSVKYIKTPEYVYLSGKCDTIFKRIEVKVPYEAKAKVVYKETPLTKWQGFKMKLGAGLFWLIIVAIGTLIIRFVIKKYTTL